LKDSSCQYAPSIEFLPEPSALEPSQGEMLEQMRISSAMAIVGHASPIDTAVDHPVRGFGKGYESFPEDLHTTIDVEHLVHVMKEQGVEVGSLSTLTFFLSDLWVSGLFIDGCWTLRQRLHILLLHGRVSPCVSATRQGCANQGTFHALLSCGPAVRHGGRHSSNTEDHPVGL
jgi:hypothetical protein